MIRINLLPVREARRRADMQQQLLLLGGVVGASLLVCVLAQGWMVASISGARTRVAEANSQIETFQEQLQQVEDFKRKAAEIEKKLEVIKKLDLARTGPVRLMDELASRTPEKLWVTSLAAEGNRIKMTGMSLDTELIAGFLNQLNDSPYVKDVELESTELSEKEGLKLNSFEITAVMTNPEAEKLDAGKPATPDEAAQPSKKKSKNKRS